MRDVFPALSACALAFANGPPELTVTETLAKIESAETRKDLDRNAEQYFALVNAPEMVLRDLYW